MQEEHTQTAGAAPELPVFLFTLLSAIMIIMAIETTMEIIKSIILIPPLSFPKIIPVSCQNELVIRKCEAQIRFMEVSAPP